MRYKSALLPPEKVLEFWPKITGHIQQGLTQFAVEMSPFDVFKLAINGDLHIWVTTDESSNIASVLCTKIEHYPQRKILTILCVAGSIKDFPSWLSEHAILESFARDFNCSAIRFYGRKGWAKRLARYRSDSGNQYLPQQQIFEMEV